MGKVNITLANGQLGATLQTADGVCGFVMTGVTEMGGYTLGTPLLVTNLTDVTTAGITAANNPFAIKQLTEYYNQAGNGAQLYIMLVSNTMTVALMASNTNANGSKKLLDFAGGKIKVLGLLSDDLAVGSGIATATLHSGGGGTGWATNDTFTVNGGTVLATGHVTGQSGGVVTTFVIDTPGEGYSVATAVATTHTSGAGTGFTVDIATLTGVTVTNGLNADVATAASNMAVTAAAYFAAQKPFRCIIGGTSYSGTASALTDETNGTTNNRTAILIGDTSTTYSGKGAALGLLLGVISSIPVQRKVSRVRTGPLTNSAVYLNTTKIESASNDPATIAGKGYITFTTYPNVSGYFFSGDPMCTATTDDYAMLARGRVIDKAHVLAYTTFVQEVDDEVPVNNDGTLDAGFCKWLSQQIVNQIGNTMKANKEISNVSCYINPNQNILSTNQLKVVLKVTPVGYADDIEISLGFDNPAL